MARLLMTAGPTREYLDSVRFLSNGSSGRMGGAIAAEAVRRGHAVVIVSGPVSVEYPAAAQVVPVVTTADMLRACQQHFPHCDCLIGVAAPCDFQPRHRAPTKIAKSGQPLQLELIETADILATLARTKTHQRIVGFALETHDHRDHAMAKLRKKGCDLIVLNDAAAMDVRDSAIEILNAHSQVIAQGTGAKTELATLVLNAVESLLPGP